MLLKELFFYLIFLLFVILYNTIHDVNYEFQTNVKFIIDLPIDYKIFNNIRYIEIPDIFKF